MVEKESEENDTGEEKLISTDVNISGKGPVESYFIIRGEFFKIKNLNDLISFSENYGSYKNNIAASNMESMVGVIDGEFIVSTIMSSVPSEISKTEIISLSDAECLIKVTSEDGKEGESKMVFEEGIWKLDYEEWDN